MKLAMLFNGIIISLLSVLSYSSLALENSQQFGEYEITYTLLPSTMINADIANAYQLKRSANEVLLNVSVTPVKSWGGIAVPLKGTIKNMLQQQKALDFKTIEEDGVTYYIAPIRVTNEEIIHFSLNVTMPDESEPREIKFTRTLYAD